MLTKVSVSCLVAFAAVAQATIPDIGGQYGYRSGSNLTSTVTVSPVPVTTAAPSGTAPKSKCSTPIGPGPISTGVSPTSSNSPLSGTGSPSGYAPVGSGSPGNSPVHGPYPIGTGAPASGYGPIGTGPIGTGPIGTGTGASTAYTTQTIDTTVTSDTTLTYTVGSGSSKTVVITTVRHTSTKTQFSVSSRSLTHVLLFSNLLSPRPSTQPNLLQPARVEPTLAPTLATTLVLTTRPVATTLPTMVVPATEPRPFHLPLRRLTSSLFRQPQAVALLRKTTALLALVVQVVQVQEAQDALLKLLSPCLARRRPSPL